MPLRQSGRKRPDALLIADQVWKQQFPGDRPLNDRWRLRRWRGRLRRSACWGTGGWCLIRFGRLTCCPGRNRKGRSHHQRNSKLHTELLHGHYSMIIRETQAGRSWLPYNPRKSSGMSGQNSFKMWAAISTTNVSTRNWPSLASAAVARRHHMQIELTKPEGRVATRQQSPTVYGATGPEAAISKLSPSARWQFEGKALSHIIGLYLTLP